MEQSGVEIMAPVGSYEALQAAIQAGAGSVYFGVGQLNMRSRSTNNFTIEDLMNIVSICRGSGIKTYLTVNTVVFDNELIELHQLLDAAKLSGITAIIASDMAAIQIARQLGLEVHISTQQNITNIEAVKFFAQFADVMVLAREMNLEQVKLIHNQITELQIKGPSGQLVQLEMFVHGALCMAVSGKCYLSLHETGHSANRGDCMQVCRRAYNVKEKELGYELEIDNQYIMSPKDLKTIHFLNKILESGVTVLKIEGRARSAEYVKTVVECYHEAVDAWQNNQFSEDKIKKWDKRLSEVFNRGFWDGYYLGQRLGEWSSNYGSKATVRKIYIGKALNYFSNIKVGEFKIETQELNVGDRILIVGPNTGVIEIEVPEIRVELQSVNLASKGDICSIPIEEKVRRSDKLYKIVDASQVRIQ
jgi:U32 family peptidase